LPANPDTLFAIQMATATFRFYEELNDFLPGPRRKQDIVVEFERHNSIKDMIESLGVPHTEIDLILVNGKTVDFSYIVRDQDRISVYPVFESLDISPLQRLRPEALRKVRFVLDTHLGKLAKYMRMLGFDTLYSNSCDDATLVKLSCLAEGRILLTRDIGLLKRKMITHGYFVRETRPRSQTREILKRFDLRGMIKPFQRCVHCNSEIQAVPKENIADCVPAGILRDFDDFVICSGCRHIYWKGSHYDRMLNFITMLTQ